MNSTPPIKNAFARDRRLALLKVVAFLASFLVYGMLAGLAILFTRDPVARRRRLARYSQRYSRLLLRFYNIEVSYYGLDHLFKKSGPCLIVPNHLSTLDIIVLEAISPMTFITSAEVREAPFIGHLAELGGCLYTERRHYNSLKKEIVEVASWLKRGFDIVVFAEGTSSDGTDVLPFKSAFFAAAKAAQATIIPVCLLYKEIDGVQLTAFNRDRLYYYGTMGFWGHLLRICANRRITVECHLLDPIETTGDRSPQDLSKATRARIAEKFFNLPLGPMGPFVTSPSRGIYLRSIPLRQ